MTPLQVDSDVDVGHVIVVQPWATEFRKTGESHDLWTIHLSDDARRKFIAAYNAAHNSNESEAVHTYADGQPFYGLVDSKLFAMLKRIPVTNPKHAWRALGVFSTIRPQPAPLA